MILAQEARRWIRIATCVLIGLNIGLLFDASAIARQAPPTAPNDLAIVGAKLYSSPDAPPVEDSVVVVKNGKIVSVGSRADTPVPSGIRVLDAHGAVLTAGFWNNHIHFMIPDVLEAATAKAETLEGSLQAMLTRWGFTTVFDLASSTDNTLALRSRIESGELAGPMILTVGDPFFPKDGTPIYVREFLKSQGWPSEEVATPREGAARAARQLERGTDGVKIFAGAIVGGKIGVLPMRVDIARAIVAQAHQRGKPAFAHPSNLAGLNVAIDSGVDVLAHTTARDGGGTGGEWSPELIARLRMHNMALIPTMTLFEVESRETEGALALLNADPAQDPTAFAKVRDTIRGGRIIWGADQR